MCPPKNDSGQSTNMAERQPSLKSLPIAQHCKNLVIASPLRPLVRFFKTCQRYYPSCARPKMVRVRRQIWPPAAIFDFHRYRISSETTGGILSKPCI